MNRGIRFIAILFWIQFLSPSVRADNIIAGQSCPALGTTTMATDQQSLVACLKDVYGNLVWKLMTSDGGVPVGTIIAWPATINPPDSASWLDCDGRALSQRDYPQLFAVVGNRIPDLRGLFLRGLGAHSYFQNNGSNFGWTETVHESAGLGVIQGDALRKIWGKFSQYKGAEDVYVEGAFVHAFTYTDDNGAGHIRNGQVDGVRDYYFDSSRMVSTANENRPVNMAVRYLIRAK